MMKKPMLFLGHVPEKLQVGGGARLFAAAGLCAVVAGCGADGMSSTAPAATLLESHPGCLGTLFADGTQAQDLSTAAAYSASWTGGWVLPQLNNGALAFGPHPMTTDWWENYSPTTSKQKPGDVLICARVRMTPEISGSPNDNTFELTMRLPDNPGFETAGMDLSLEANAGLTRLRTRTGADSHIDYDTKPLASAPGTALTYELLLFGQGNRFVAEARNTNTGQAVLLRASATLPAGGAVTMLGWRNRQGAYIDRLVIGQPSLSISGTLLSELSP